MPRGQAVQFCPHCGLRIMGDDDRGDHQRWFRHFRTKCMGIIYMNEDGFMLTTCCGKRYTNASGISDHWRNKHHNFEKMVVTGELESM